MASGAKMSYNHFQSGKFGGLPQSSQKDVEVTQDMHLKMSKKIAQLTKVIYALNTKNDENEQVLQALRDQHEEEIQQILADTKQKVAIFKDRLEEESDHRSTIEALQTRIAEQQSQHDSLQDQFETYKAEFSEKQEKERQDYAKKLFDMSHEVLTAKKEFEAYIEGFNNWKERILAEHNTALADQASKHQAELEELRGLQRDQDDTWLNQCAKIEEKFKGQIDNLKSQLEGMESEKLRLSEEYSIKLEKAKAFYEKELAALQQQQNQEQNEQVANLRKEIDRLKNDFSANDKELRIQIDRLVRQLADTEDALEATKKQEQLLQAELAGKHSSSGELSKQLQDLREELAAQSTVLKNTETELAGSKQHCTDLADELSEKSTKLGELEAHNLQKGNLITSLQSELEKMKEQLTRIDAERTSLLSQQQSVSSQQSTQIQTLRQAIEDLTVEKETQKQRFEKQLKSLQEEMARREKELKEEMSKKLSEIEKTHQESKEKERKTAAEVLVATKQELKETHEAEMNRAKASYESLKQEMEKMRSELTAKIASAESEVLRLETLVKETEAGLGNASGQMASLRDAANQLRAELEKSRSELKTAKQLAADLQAELDKMKMLHEGKMSEMETNAKKRLEKAVSELENKWKETMKIESGKLRAELSSQKDEEKKAALAQLAKLKDEEIMAVRAGLDQQMDHLRKQIEMLEETLNASKLAEEAQRVEFSQRLEREKSMLSKEMLEAASEYSTKIKAMEKMQAEELERLAAQKDLEREEMERSLQQKHLEDLQGQMAAHKAAMENASQLEQRQRKEALDALKAQQKEELDLLRQQLEGQKQAEIEALKQSHANEIRAARMELDRAVEIAKQKDKDHQIQAEELRTEITHREQHIANLQDQLRKLQEEIDKLGQEIKDKVKEIKQVEKQAQQNLKIQAEHMSNKHQQSIENLNADHQRELQDMLNQFKGAQEMLKDKISELQIELNEAQMRYDQRDSRPEDLELIESLRLEVNEREGRIKDLIDEKRFYQLELVNRETNFNKVFNTTPNVGVLNPFSKPKKKGPNLSMANGGSHQRLDPLPGSPLHDSKLNPAKPLPQPAFTKKFVK